MDSVIQKDKYCFRCGTRQNLHSHHIFNGASRKKSEEDGLKIWLCASCHELTHKKIEVMNFYKKLGERYYIANIGGFKEYMKRYKKNYLDEEEIYQAETDRTLRDIERGKNAIR